MNIQNKIGRGYLPELFRQIRTYLPELFWQIKTYLPEPVLSDKKLFAGTPSKGSLLINFISELDSLAKK